MTEVAGGLFDPPAPTGTRHRLDAVKIEVPFIPRTFYAATDAVGARVKVKIVKNKVAPPFRQAEFDIMYNEGISKSGDILELGTSMGIIDKRGAFFRYNDGMLGQGRENAKQFLRDHKEMADAIEKKVREQSGVVANSMLAPQEEGDDAEAAD